MNLSIKLIFGACMTVFTITLTQAQVGIGTANPSTSAQLDNWA